MDLVEFLTACLDEDQRLVDAYSRGDAEIAAKRRIVQRYIDARDPAADTAKIEWPDTLKPRGPAEVADITSAARALHVVLQVLAEPYADHNSFREEWALKPS